MFKFKQFAIDDSRCGMKVGTDGVLLGAWTQVNPGERVWDVGAGSGLIALMSMQRGASNVKAFEINRLACADMAFNIERSPWASHIEIVEGDFVEQSERVAGHPDLIVSNPPFFNETLRSPDDVRADARHESALEIATVMRIASRRLVSGGRLAIVAPVSRLDELCFSARLVGLHLLRRAMVVTVAGKSPKRFMGEWGAEDPHLPLRDETIVIREKDGTYNEEYARLVGDFYLWGQSPQAISSIT